MVQAEDWAPGPPAWPSGSPGSPRSAPGWVSPGWAPPGWGSASSGAPLPSLPGGRAAAAPRAAVAIACVEAVVIAVLAGALVAAHSSPEPPFAASVAPPSGSFTRQMGRVVYRTRFRPHDGWFTGRVNSNMTANISSAGYVVSGSSMVHHVLAVPYGVAHRAISVDAVATNYVGSDVSVGAGCQSASGISPPLAYQIVVYPSGQWYLEQARIGGTVHTLTSGLSSPLGPTASVQVTCAITSVASGWETTQLVGYVDGARVGSIGDKVDEPGVSGYLPVLLLGTFGPKGSATFTSVTERSFGPPPASAD